jgi:hypothetical protein
VIAAHPCGTLDDRRIAIVDPQEEALTMLAMYVELVQPLRPRLASRRDPRLTACPLCLRALRGSVWVEAERAIQELRTYELEGLPRFKHVCDHCTDSILSRREGCPRRYQRDRRKGR